MAKHSEFGVPRLLVIDDNVAIHEDFRKVLCESLEKEAEDAYLAAEAALFGEVVANRFGISGPGRRRDGSAGPGAGTRL
jgi:hypothetical protein